MKKLEKLNKELFLSLKNNRIAALNQITGGETKTTMGSNTAIGADGKLKRCDYKDKQDYVVTKDGVKDIGSPYGFEVIECCITIQGNSADLVIDQFNGLNNESN